jgi:hypothetical protein
MKLTVCILFIGTARPLAGHELLDAPSGAQRQLPVFCVWMSYS